MIRAKIKNQSSKYKTCPINSNGEQIVAIMRLFLTPSFEMMGFPTKFPIKYAIGYTAMMIPITAGDLFRLNIR